MMNHDGIDVRRGRLMNRVGTSGFKLVVVLGDAPKAIGRVRVCVWSANQGRWSQPQTADPDLLRPISYPDLASRHRRVVDTAMKHIRQHQGVVSWGNGVHDVGDPWCADRRTKSKTETGVTKLAPVTLSASKKTQVQSLNKALSNWMFGGRKP